MLLTLKKGPAVLLLSSALFAVANLFLKLASGLLPTEELALVRCLFGIAVVLILSWWGLADLTTHKKGLLIVRGLVGGMAMILFFLAIGLGSLTNTMVLNNTSPIFAALFAAIFLKERISWRVLIPLVGSLIGIYLLVHPNFHHIRLGDVLALGSGILSGVIMVIIRELRKTESAWSIFFYFSVFGAIYAGVMTVPVFEIPTWLGWTLMLVAASFATAGQIAMTWGFKYCTAAEGGILSMASAPMGVLLGLVFLGEKLTLVEGAGVLLALVGSTVLSVIGPGDGGTVSSGASEVGSTDPRKTPGKSSGESAGKSV